MNKCDTLHFEAFGRSKLITAAWWKKNTALWEVNNIWIWFRQKARCRINLPASRPKLFGLWSVCRWGIQKKKNFYKWATSSRRGLCADELHVTLIMPDTGGLCFWSLSSSICNNKVTGRFSASWKATVYVMHDWIYCKRFPVQCYDL